MHKPCRVLFLSEGNSARSILAECVLTRLGNDRFLAFSAGILPRGRVHPYALECLNQQGYSTESVRSKSWDKFAPPFKPYVDFVFILCTDPIEETCSLWFEDAVVVKWAIPDPATVNGTETAKRAAFSATLKTLTERLNAFANLSDAQLENRDVRTHLKELGKL